MKRTIIIVGFIVAAVIGFVGVLGHLTVIACSILLLQNTFIMFGHMRSGKSTMSRDELIKELRLAKRRINMLTLNLQVESRRYNQLEANKIELQKKIIDGEDRTEEETRISEGRETIRYTGDDGFSGRF